MRTPKTMSLGLVICCATALAAGQSPSNQKTPFTVKDDIGITQFGDVYRSPREDVVISPTGRFVAVHTVSASLGDGRIHDKLWIYETGKLRSFVNGPPTSKDFKPLWTIEESSKVAFADEPLITSIRWLRNETGLAFLLRKDEFHRHLVLAEITSRQVVTLSPEHDDVLSFSVDDRMHYVFTVPSAVYPKILEQRGARSFKIGTGRPFNELMFPDQTAQNSQRGELWAVSRGVTSRIMDRLSGKPVILYEDGIRDIVLSPDGKSVVTVRPVEDIPKAWETLYPPTIFRNSL